MNTLKLVLSPIAKVPRVATLLDSEHFSRRCLTALASCAAIALVADVNTGRRGCLVLLVVDQALLDIRSEAIEGLVDVNVALGGDLEEWDSKLIGQSLSLLSSDDALLFPVTLVADQDLVDALGRVLLDVGEPRSDVCNAMLVQLSRPEIQ